MTLKLLWAGCTNIAHLSCQNLNSSVLQHMLPKEWHNTAAPVDWIPGDSCSITGWHAAAQQQQEPSSGQQPTVAWIRQLWKWLQDKPVEEMTQLGSWPLLPIRGRKLLRIQMPVTVRWKADLFAPFFANTSGQALATVPWLCLQGCVSDGRQCRFIVELQS